MLLLSAIASAAILTFGAASHASSETITFEGLCAPDWWINNIADGYDGFRWAHIGAIGKDYTHDSGYEAVVHGSVAGYSWPQKTARFSSGTPFSLLSGHFAAAWHPLQVSFTAYRDGVLMGTKTVSLDQTDTKVLFDESFAHIDTVKISASREFHADQVAFDNLKVVLDH